MVGGCSREKCSVVKFKNHEAKCPTFWTKLSFPAPAVLLLWRNEDVIEKMPSLHPVGNTIVKTNVSLIAGIVSAAAFLLLVALAVMCLYKRNLKQKYGPYMMPDSKYKVGFSEQCQR